MKLALLALFLFSSLASGQAVEENYVSRFPGHVRLLPKDFLKPQPQKLDLTSWFTVDYHLSYSENRDWETDHSQTEIFIPGFVSLQATQVQLAIIKNSYMPIEGNFSQQIGHIFKEGLSNLGTSNTAATYYRDYGLSVDPNRARAEFAYDHNGARLVYGPMLPFGI